MKKHTFRHKLIKFITHHAIFSSPTVARKLDINSGTVGSYFRYFRQAGLIKKTDDSIIGKAFYYKKTEMWSRENALDAINKAHEELMRKYRKRGVKKKVKKRVYKYHKVIDFINKHVIIRPSTVAEELGFHSGTVHGYCGHWYRAGLLEKITGTDTDIRAVNYQKTKEWTREEAVNALQEVFREHRKKYPPK